MSTLCGSSPLTRGKLFSMISGLPVLRLIPAHAGKTCECRNRCIWREAHPRSRGENEAGDEKGSTFDGSSPLTRGKQCDDAGHGGRDRLIPAHAGKTLATRRAGTSTTAHPRSRGENSSEAGDEKGSTGSSPLTRGKRLLDSRNDVCERLIPAHAGKTAMMGPLCSYSSAHPRSRGENPKTRPSARCDSGSSPLTRGKHFLTCDFIAEVGQILESLELCASSGSYSLMDAYATDAPQDRVRSIGLAPRSSRGAS